MSEFKGTKGQWSVSDDREGLTYADQEMVDMGIIRQTIIGGDPPFYLAVVIDDIPNGQANARAIAAVPEMIAALEACLPLADSDGVVNGVNIRAALSRALTPEEE